MDYKLSDEVMKCIKSDSENKKVWDDVLQYRAEGAQKFLAQVEEVFGCICCQDIVFKPVTTSCSHNVCKVRVNLCSVSLKRAKHGIFTLPNPFLCSIINKVCLNQCKSGIAV